MVSVDSVEFAEHQPVVAQASLSALQEEDIRGYNLLAIQIVVDGLASNS